VVHGRDDLVARLDAGGVWARPSSAGSRAVDVRVEDADLGAERAQRGREVGADRRLADAALAAATAMMFLTPGRRGFEGWLGRPADLRRERTSTPVTPGSLPTASSIDVVMTSFDGQAGVVSSMPMTPRGRRRARPTTPFRATRSRRRARDPFTGERRRRISSTVGMRERPWPVSVCARMTARDSPDRLVGMMPHFSALDRQILALCWFSPTQCAMRSRPSAGGAQARHLERVVGQQANRAQRRRRPGSRPPGRSGACLPRTPSA
jgi:hypothetical protein